MDLTSLVTLLTVIIIAGSAIWESDLTELVVVDPGSELKMEVVFF